MPVWTIRVTVVSTQQPSSPTVAPTYMSKEELSPRREGTLCSTLVTMKYTSSLLFSPLPAAL